MKSLHIGALILAVAATLLVGYVWAEFTHRVSLFYIEYHRDPY